MKVYPKKIVRELIQVKDRELSITERTTRIVAMVVVFATVGFFFMKIVLF